MTGKKPCLSFVKNRGRMEGKKTMHSGKIQKEEADGMKDVVILCLVDRLAAVKACIMAVLCHSGFKNIGHFRKNHTVHAFMFIEDTRKEQQELLQSAG